MRGRGLSTLFGLILALLLPVVAFRPAQIPLSDASESDPLDVWLEAEIPYALDGVLNNIGSRGAKATGVYEGVVIASPSKNDPNYFYTWTRDAALTIKCLVDAFAVSNDPRLQQAIRDYIDVQVSLQTVSTPSGDLATGGLGEPKFEADLVAFTGEWGRPQRDGPALRAIAIIAYADWLIEQGHASVVDSFLWPVVRNDLSYVSEYWNTSTYDIWEEVHGSSFFTTAVQHRALVDGAALALQLNRSCPNCLSQAPQILCFLQSFWSPSDAFIHANTNLHHNNNPPRRSGKDSSAILASIHAFNPLAAAACDDPTSFQPCSARALASHKAITDSFRPLYPINQGIPAGHAVAVGRYPEDVYQGGQPWYLCTLAAAQQLYHAVAQWKRLGSLNITAVNLPFFRDIYPSAAAGVYTSPSQTFCQLVEAVETYADGFMRIVQKYSPANGALAEQFSRVTGTPLSAKDLTWSYVALLTASAARAHARGTEQSDTDMSLAGLDTPPSPPPSLPNICAPTSATGPYIPATKISWPKMPCLAPGEETIPVRFNVRVSTIVGEDILVVGSVAALGQWDVRQAVRLSADEYGVVPLWYGVVELRVGREMEYKFIKRRADEDAGDVVWENRLNRELRVEEECLGGMVVNAVWGESE
ncbi:hypothetical protein FE257_002806 [Aspergillus nanangensis]|uniref:Glucoamylase n=1 Tax=Aspergillus nanangensis TaxID=2582783 RepID=A0AAD4CC90_ASPNN|nr:hypothetical protein FE257_002806 [Aspergillus nanangensis]